MKPIEGPPAYRILVYGIEAKGIPEPKRRLTTGKYTIEFARQKDAPRFQEFDGVLVFQGTFESFEWNQGIVPYLKHYLDRNELDRRTKQALSLIDKGGFVCLLLIDRFMVRHNNQDYSDTDLSKRLLSMYEIVAEGFPSRKPIVKSAADDLREFFEHYGAACSRLTSHDPRCRTLAFAGGNSVSIAAAGSVFAIPTLVPEPNDEAIEEYFTILTEGIGAYWERFKVELPRWARVYRVPEEALMLETHSRLAKEMAEIEARLGDFDRLKRVLVLQGEPLVEAVMEVFDRALPLKSRREEAFREDLTLVDFTGNAIALAEVKGVSRGVAREHVNQADSHRERNSRPPEFPSLLIINTNAKKPASLADKDQAVAPEQVEHAVRNNVLILRTLDLLNLASLHMGGTLKAEEVVELLTKSRGWLKVGEKAEVVFG